MKKLVFDIGGSSIKYALMDDEATLYERGKVPTPQDSLAHFIEVLKSIYDMYKEQIDGIALSIPGTVDSKTGQIYAPGALTYNANVNMAEQIHTFTDVPVVLENDGKSAALAEVWKGNLVGCESGIVLVLGTGIGGGIVKDGKVWRGSHLFAGEFSFILGTREGLDILALKGSTTALIMGVASRKQVKPETIDGLQVFKMIEEGDVDAIASLDDVTMNLAREIFNLQCVIDPEKVLIGGGISQQPIVLEKIRSNVEKIYASLPFQVPHVEIDTCAFYNDSNLIGALYNFFQHTS